MLPQITENSRDVPEVVPEGRYERAIRGYRPGAISLAHCGGLGSGFLLLTEVLGIKPKGPGFRGCTVTPLIGLLPNAAGTFPSPRGDISVSWERRAGRATVAVSMPGSLDGELRLPTGATHELPAGRRTEVRAEA